MPAKKLNTFYIFIILGFLVSCNDKPDYPDTPEIEFIKFSKSSMNQGAILQDSVIIELSFTDGDGDLGVESKDTTSNLFITDNRTGFLYTPFKLPIIPTAGANNGVSGTLRLKIYTTCCIFPDLIPPCTTPPAFPDNEINFDIYMVDRAGNESNTITTSNLSLICN